MDNSSIHPLCESQAHLIELHLWRGAPKNLDETRPVQILVNHGFVVGFSPDRLQPIWSAYRVSDYDRDVDYARPIHYHDDMRLDEELRIGRKTFGKLGGIQLNVGHMAPNEVINRQFGRLAQLETFMMTNMSPQYGSLNGGVWLKLEDAIREIKDERVKDHVWVIVGPVFGENPASVNRGRGKYLPVPEKYFCVTVEPHSYAYDTLSRAYIDCFLIPQNAPSRSSPVDYPATLEEIEEATNLSFFDAWSRDVPLGLSQSVLPPSKSSLMQILEDQRSELQPRELRLKPTDTPAKTVEDLIAALRSEAAALQIQSQTLTDEELSYLKTVQHTISWLHRAQSVQRNTADEVGREVTNFVTYKIISDMADKLKMGARTSCNFWNRFVRPKFSIVIRLGIFTQNSGTIARAYKPYEKDGVRYGVVEFNTRYLGEFSDDSIAGTIIHEIGHSLGIGWEEWDDLFVRRTGKFKRASIRRLEALDEMEVELDGGPGTELAHWDEDRFSTELMTGYKDQGEHVLPVTIEVMALLGHEVIESLTTKTQLSDLLRQAESVIFSKQDQVRAIDLEHFEKTELMETIPHGA